MRILSHGHDLADLASGVDGGLSPEVQRVREQLRTFELGAFLLKNLGLNGYWTSYVVLHPDQGRKTGLGSDGAAMGELERWLLDRCPAFLATQERFRIFRSLTQPFMTSGTACASIPCGLMDDLLSGDDSGINGMRLTGVDLDAESLTLARANAARCKLQDAVTFEQRDAWHLDSASRWDLITSNGLNIYVEDDSKCVDLYKSFASALAAGGHLVTSFITPPETWQPHHAGDLERQRFLFGPVVPVKWQCTRSEMLTREQLAIAGFEVLCVQYDAQRIFPAVLARKL
ncbi:MAG: class I SAM-dependent methyltransferase [Planctomycetales bacterium]|jgi:SAM-dependent methyltransferase|nr:class I SAM-dependent methyltransferase [Planctomycetales bacterium]